MEVLVIEAEGEGHKMTTRVNADTCTCHDMLCFLCGEAIKRENSFEVRIIRK